MDNSYNNLPEFPLFWNVLMLNVVNISNSLCCHSIKHKYKISYIVFLHQSRFRHFSKRATSISKVKSVNRYGRNLTSRPGKDIEREREKKIGKAVERGRGEKELGADAWIGMRHRLPKENHFALRPRYSIVKYPSVPRMFYVYCVASTLPCISLSSKQLSDTRSVSPFFNPSRGRRVTRDADILEIFVWIFLNSYIMLCKRLTFYPERFNEIFHCKWFSPVIS